MNNFTKNDHLPLIGILRGVEPDDCIRVANILISAGFSIIEVPLNSPDALESIKRMVNYFNLDEVLIGAGTVTDLNKAKDVIDIGANLIVTPNINLDVITTAVEANCVVFPGVVTPTEAFSALQAGATGLKLFPVSMIGLDGFSAIQSVLPQDSLCFPVGGIDATINSMLPYVKAGAAGFGLGSALYKPSMSDEEVRANALKFVSVYKHCLSS